MTHLTLFSLSQHQTKPTRGHVTVAGYDSTDNRISSVLGVCPQFDRVVRELTVEENLLFFARARGARGALARRLAEHSAAMVGLGSKDVYARKAEQLSGGMRRRLSLGIAMIGSPEIILLDEPTTGLDPANRAQIWKIIANIKEAANQVVLITTHSMDEADALCTRIGIMAAGNLRCLGTQLELKNRYGQGYTLSVQCQIVFPMAHGETLLDVESAFELEKLVLENIDTFMLHVTEGRVSKNFVHDIEDTRYRIESGQLVVDTMSETAAAATWNVYFNYALARDVDLANVFGALVQHAAEYGIVEWGINQSSLEDVFIAVAENYVSD